MRASRAGARLGYRSGRWGVLADLAYVAVSVEAQRNLIARLPGFSSAEVKSRTFNATATGFYRFYENGRFSADILAGARVWSASTDVDLLTRWHRRSLRRNRSDLD